MASNCCSHAVLLLVAMSTMDQAVCEGLNLREVEGGQTMMQDNAIRWMEPSRSRKLLGVKNSRTHKKMLHLRQKTKRHRTVTQQNARSSLRGAIKSRLSCPNPGSPVFGHMHIMSSGGKATYGCNQGYKLVGLSSRSCTPQGVWSGGTPECKLHIKHGNDGTFHTKNRQFVIGLTNAS
jgi:hypothetical protein